MTGHLLIQAKPADAELLELLFRDANTIIRDQNFERLCILLQAHKNLRVRPLSGVVDQVAQ